MASVQSVWGIDVGRCALKAIKLRAAGDGKVEVVAHDYVEHAKILTQPDADRPALIAAALEKFLSRNDITKDQVFVSVPGQHTLARFTKLPPVADKRIPDIVRYEADQQIPFDMDEVIWDYQIFREEGAPDTEVGIFAMKRELIREHLLHFEQVSIEPIGVQCGPLAVFNAAVFDGLVGNEATILLDIGAESTDLIIGTQNGLWTRTINIGGNNLTDALVKSFKLSFAKAENLKRTAADSKYARQIFQAMRPIFADLVQELQRSIGFFSSTHRDAKVERVVTVGNAMMLPGLQKYLQQNLGMTVDKPESFRNCVSPAPSGSQLAEQHSSFWVAYGLAIQGLELSRVTSNLLPTEIAKQVVWRKKRPAFAAAAACLLLSGGIIWLRYSNDAQAAAPPADLPSKLDIEGALNIIENGPSSALSDRARAISILRAGEEVKKAVAELSGKKKDDGTEELVTLLASKKTVPKVIELIHAALPIAADPASWPQSSTDVAAHTTIPRKERKWITIDRLDTQYMADVNEPFWEVTSKVDVPPRVVAEDAVERGLKIELSVSTPFAGGMKFVQTEYMDKLRKIGREPGLGFYFDRIWLIEGAHAALKGAGAGDDADASKPSGRGGGAGAGTDKSELDLITLEPINDDWNFKIWIDVILKDFPEEEGESGEGAPGDETGEGNPEGKPNAPKKPQKTDEPKGFDDGESEGG